MTPRPGDTVGPYVLGPLIGRGGMGVVHSATHRTTGRVVALKLMTHERPDPGIADRLRREARIQAGSTIPGS